MGFLDALFGKTKCPDCGTKGARKSGDRVRCPNPSCKYFDGSLRGLGGRSNFGRVLPPRRSDYSPETALEIRYRNFQGQEKTFAADRETLRRKRNHIIARVAPTGENISLSCDRIQNFAEVEQALPQSTASEVAALQAMPTARERRVLSFHKNHHSTSPLYEQIRAKYPDW